ncbi:MAG: NADPH-dependent FMN reductase [Thermoplasmata archaeon]
MPLDLPILMGSMRAERRSIWVARYVHARLAQRPDVTTRLWDPVDLPFGNLVLREWEMTERPAAVDEFVRAMEHADGFVIVTPEYNYGMPGTLKNLIDHLFDEWNRKPFGFVTAGGVAGGVRAQDQLRQVISGIRAITIPTAIPVMSVEHTWDENGPKADRKEWDSRFDRFFSELEWYARALKSAREEPAR